MKILYLVDVDLDRISGVSSKVLMQVKAWEKEGHKVYLLSIFSLSFFNIDGKRLTKSIIKRKTDGKLSFIINVYKSSILLKSLISDVEFDVVYMRYKIYDFFFKSAVKNKPIIAEMNTVYERETKVRSYVSYIYYMLFKSLSFRTIDGFVCISNEIKKITLQNKYESIVLANGIDIKSYIPKRKQNNKRPMLVFIGSPNQVWHGVDKIIFLSSKLQQYDFHIIGMNGINTDNLVYHGYLSTEEFLPILNKADIGIGSLAMHRLGLDEASPLKSRLYLSYGLPIIYAYEDTDIKNDFSFTLKLSNKEDNIKNNINSIEKFVNSVFNNQNIQNEAKEFAKSILDVEKKEKKRLQFMQNILLDKGKE